MNASRNMVPSFVGTKLEIDKSLRSTVNGELVPETVLRIEDLHDKFALLNAVAMNSDELALKTAREKASDYWNSVQFAAAPFYSNELTSKGCQVDFYKLLDSYVYLISHLIDWPPNCLQRLWPLFAFFHKFRDLSPFFTKIHEKRDAYDKYPKSYHKWVTGGPFVPYNRPQMISSLPLINPNVPLMAPLFSYPSSSIQGDKSQFNSEYCKKPIDDHHENTTLTSQNWSNGTDDSNVANDSLDVKSIVKGIVSQLSVTKGVSSVTKKSTTVNEINNSMRNVRFTLPFNENESNSLISDRNEKIECIETTNGKEARKNTHSFKGNEESKKDYTLQEEITITECVKRNMKLNEFLLNFQRDKFWERVVDDLYKTVGFKFDVEKFFKHRIGTYMETILYKECFYCDTEYMKKIWPLFPYYHDLDISSFLESNEVDKYRRAKLELQCKQK